jgi:histidine decarboxylase
MNEGPFSLADVVNGAVGNVAGNCMGYMNPGASGSGYIATMKLSVDKIDMTGLDPGAGGIVSYDRCEKDDAYIGQINMGTASSFCGVNGALWGFHLAVADQIKDGTLKSMFTYPGHNYPPDEKLPTQGVVPVYPVAPLLDAAERLFGRMDPSGDGENDLRRFPPLPGAHVICANKDASGMGPGYFWSAIGIAIAQDRDTQANLFIEDTALTPTRPRPSRRRRRCRRICKTWPRAWCCAARTRTSSTPRSSSARSSSGPALMSGAVHLPARRTSCWRATRCRSCRGPTTCAA